MSSSRQRAQLPTLDPNERQWLERKALALARERKCSLPAALVAARCEFESLRSRPKAPVISLVGRTRGRLSRPPGARS